MQTRPLVIPLDDYAEYRNAAPGTDGLIALGIDWASATVRLTGSGFWSVPQIDAYFVHLQRLNTRLRAVAGRALVLADMRASPTQSTEVAARLHGQTDNLYRDGDHSALVVPTSLAKMQLRRLLDARYHAFFLSIDAAETWLGAWR